MLHNTTAATVEATPLHAGPLDAREAVALLEHATAEWHRSDAAALEGDALLLALHRANFDLWHLEDRARDPDATDKDVADVKRAIDRVNQQRNDFVEQLDGLLLGELAEQHLPRASAPLHSETPGMILDRLSILTLKTFHTREEAQRTDADEPHRLRNIDRLAVLERQKDDLAGCLDVLWSDILAGLRTFQLYRQMKMYNDPALNPVLYRARKTDA